MKKIGYNIFWTFVFTIFASIGMSMTLKADVGLGSINAVSSAVSHATTVQVGTIVTVVNVLCVLIQLVIQRRDFHWRQWLQIAVSYLLGVVVNIMYYTVFSTLVLEHYIIKLLFFIAGVMISAIGIAVVIKLNLVVFPVEAASMAIAVACNTSFKNVRQKFDIVAIVIACTLAIAVGGPITVREGTVISMIILGHVVQWLMHLIEKYRLFNGLEMS